MSYFLFQPVFHDWCNKVHGVLSCLSWDCVTPHGTVPHLMGLCPASWDCAPPHGTVPHLMGLCPASFIHNKSAACLSHFLRLLSNPKHTLHNEHNYLCNTGQRTRLRNPRTFLPTTFSQHGWGRQSARKI